MARARRAKRRWPYAVVALVVLVLVAGGVVATLRFRPGSPIAGGSTPSPVAVTSEPTAPATSTPTPKPAGGTTSPAATSEAVRTLASCQDRVRAADRVLAQARTGVSHWAEHVTAERDAEADRIDAETQQAIFKRTRLKGPTDQRRYAEALQAYADVRAASCGRVRAAGPEVTAALAACDRRSRAQRPVLAAAAAAMGDWRSHLGDMQRSRQTHVADAQGIWIAAYRAAPRHLDAYERARTEFAAPRC